MTKRRLQLEDLYRIQSLLSPTVSADDRMVAFVTRHADRPRGRGYASEIRIASRTKSRDPGYEVGPSDVVNHSPRWAPARPILAFLAPVGGADQLWVFDTTSESLSCVTKLKKGVQQFAWSSDGTRLVLSALVHDEDQPVQDSDLRIITSIRDKVASQRPWKSEEVAYKQLFIVDLASGGCRQITQGRWDCVQPAWSPTSDEIAFTSNRTEDPDPMVMSDIWLVRADGANLTNLTQGRGVFGGSCWSPDGSKIAVLGYERGEKPSYQTFIRVWTVIPENKRMECLTSDLDMTCSNCAITDVRPYGGFDPGVLSWSASDGLITFLASTSGTTQLMSVNPDSREFRQITEGAHEVYAFQQLNRTGGFVLAVSDPVSPGDLWELDAQGTYHRLTRVNPWLEDVSLSSLEARTIEPESGPALDGWIMRPVGFEEGRQFPAIVQVHRLMFAHTFFFECQLMAASGFVVFYMNQHGSFGYGQEFAFAEYSEQEMLDLQAGTEMLGREPYVDAGKIGVCGGSNGGYLVFSLLAASDLFAAGVGQRGISNLTSIFGSSDIGYHHEEWIVGGAPWNLPEAYQRLSPITYVDQITAPLLIVHSDRDTRVPIEQAEQMFVSLKKLGRDVAFARFRNEGHDLSRTGQPRNRVARLGVILEWFREYMR